MSKGNKNNKTYYVGMDFRTLTSLIQIYSQTDSIAISLPDQTQVCQIKKTILPTLLRLFASILYYIYSADQLYLLHLKIIC